MFDMSDADSVLFANEAFYRAFAEGDAQAMEQLWSARDDITCLHPGWGPIFGRAEVMASWSAIFASAQMPGIGCLDPRARIHGDVAYVVCFEQLPGGRLAATNLFAREGTVWKMILHQAGPTADGAGPAPGPGGQTGSVH